MNKIIQAQYQVNRILRYGVLVRGLIPIGLRMFGGGIRHINESHA